MTEDKYHGDLCEQDSHKGPYFTPSLWKQRRAFILDTLKRHKIQKVLDYGCGEGAVISFLIPPSATDDVHFTYLAGLDIDRPLLEKETLAACRPWPSDYHYLREAPLTVEIYHGSVDQADSRLLGYDAIVCTEVIEHLYPDTLEGCLHVMLGVYAPPLVIVTTPNAEYNVFFPFLRYGTADASLRHDDHKFEWSRQEFQSWCNRGAQQYGYSVDFHGIGLLDGKLDNLEHGYCTQACVFTKDPSLHNQHRNSHLGTPHTMLKQFKFLYYNEPPLSDDALLLQIESYLSDLCQTATLQQTITTAQEREAVSHSETSTGLNDPTWSTDNYSFDDDGNNTNIDDGTTGLAWCTEYTYDGAKDRDGDDSNDTSDEDATHEQWTMTPIAIDVDSLWSILNVRQLCKKKQRLLDVLQLGQQDYQVMGDQVVVHKSFRITLL